ncbi:MAG: thiamine phosphate synthase [Alphaproteobacteria bacterium]|nr:thiamine phosphate synthase [Alphaproteobacteria bacterium]
MKLPRPALPDPPLLVITDRHQARRPLEEMAEAAFAGGCRWLSLREKDLDTGERRRLLRRLAEIGAAWGATVGVHDDLAAAEAVPGAALHLPAGASVAAARRALGAGRLIGISTHAGDALAGHDEADYVTISPIRPSASKPGYGPAIGLAGLREAVRCSSVPVIALGGIGPPDIAPCLTAGAAGVAVMGGVMSAADPQSALAALVREWRTEVRPTGSG